MTSGERCHCHTHLDGVPCLADHVLIAVMAEASATLAALDDLAEGEGE